MKKAKFVISWVAEATTELKIPENIDVRSKAAVKQYIEQHMDAVSPPEKGTCIPDTVQFESDDPIVVSVTADYQEDWGYKYEASWTLR